MILSSQNTIKETFMPRIPRSPSASLADLDATVEALQDLNLEYLDAADFDAAVKRIEEICAIAEAASAADSEDDDAEDEA
jgi:hypothetical protein